MRTGIRSTVAILGVTILFSAPLAAQDPRASLLVNAQWLAQNLRDPHLVLLHVSDRADYDKAHIAGAQFADMHSVLDMQDPATRLSWEMPANDSLRTRMERLGISDNSRIVVYFSNGYVSPATRVLLTLQYAGANPVFLDGGMGAWTRGGNATTAEPTPAKPGKLSALKTRPLVVDAAYVQANVGKPGIAIVDGRAASFYDGIQEGGPQDARKKGHIQGALSVPFTLITTDALELKSAEELGALFTKAGVKPGDRIVGYCHIGQQATAMLFAARTLGYDVVLYDGSFEDWSRRGLPVAVPPGR